MTLSLEQRVAELEAFVDAMKQAIGAPKTVKHRTTRADGSEPEVAGDELLSKPWADMESKRDPKFWNGESFVGRRFSECPAEYLTMLAEFHDWKAKKGKEEDPPRLNSKGEPWWKSDELIAKVARGWAARANGRPAARPAPKPKAPPVPFDAPDDGADDVPF